MALGTDEQKMLRDWNAAHPYEDQYNPSSGKKIPNSAKAKPVEPAKAAASAPAKAAPKAAGKPATVTKGLNVSSTPKPIDQEILAQKFGLAKSLMDSSPELKSLFADAVKNSWTTEMFQARLQNTKWFQSMPETQRKMLVLHSTDPATYQRLWSTAYDHVQSMAGQMGVNPDDVKTIGAVASQVFFQGWTDERARTELGMHIQFGSSGMAHGQAGQIQSSINSYSYSMGVKNSDEWTRSRIVDVMMGRSTEQDAKNEVMQQALAAFPQYGDQIKAGMTVSDLAAPYTQSMSQILELAPGQVNLFDPTIRKTMSYRDPTGSGAAMPIWQFQNSLREDERWKKTQNAQDQLLGTAKTVLQSFGQIS